MDKALFKEYEKWCVSQNKDPLEEGSLSEFKDMMVKKDEEEAEKAKNSEERKAKVEKQKKIFEMLQDYAGVKTKYDEEYMFDALDTHFKALVLAALDTEAKKEVRKALCKILNG